MTRFRGVLVGGLLAVTVPGLAAAQWSGLAVTPYVGVFAPTKDLFTPANSIDPSRAGQKIDVSLTYGLRASVGVAPHWGVEADVSVASGHLVVSSIGTVAGNDVKTTLGSGRVYYRTKPASEPFSATALAGVAVISHRFSPTNSGSSPVVSDKTSLGGVVGGTIAFRLEERAALTFGLDAFVYRGRYEYNGTLSESQAQLDAKLYVGLRIAIAGY